MKKETVTVFEEDRVKGRFFLIGEFVYLFIYLRLTTFISKEN